MRVALDVLPARNKTGLGTYTLRLVAALLDSFPSVRWTLIGDALSLACVDPQRRALHVDLCGTRFASWAELPPIPERTEWRRLLGAHLEHSPPDLFHSPAFYRPLGGGSAAAVVTIHDVLFRTRPGDYAASMRQFYEDVTVDACHRARAVICDSHATKDALLAHFPASRDIAHVVHLGVSGDFRPAGPEEVHRLLREYDLRAPYVLNILGGWSDRKNLPNLLRAYAIVRRQARRAIPELVVVCHDLSDRALAVVGNTRGVRLLPYVPDYDLPVLISGARCLVHPSYAEGFGLPVLESMACGVPIVVSDLPVLREIAGDCAIFVDPTSPHSIAAGIGVALEAPTTQDLRLRGLERAARFSWKRAAAGTMDVYNAILAER